jgi:hypothetical protein
MLKLNVSPCLEIGELGRQAVLTTLRTDEALLRNASFSIRAMSSFLLATVPFTPTSSL